MATATDLCGSWSVASCTPSRCTSDKGMLEKGLLGRTNNMYHVTTCSMLWIVMFSRVFGLPRWRNGVSHSLQCAWPVWPPGSEGLGPTPGSGGLSVHAGQLSIYSEINISGRHRVLCCVLLNLWQTTRTAFKGAGPLVRAGVGITDEASSGTISGARPQRNPTYRPSYNRHKPINLPSFSLAHTTHMDCQQKVAVAVHHLHLDTLPILPSHSGRACTLGHLNWPQRCSWQM